MLFLLITVPVRGLQPSPSAAIITHRNDGCRTGKVALLRSRRQPLRKIGDP